MRQALVLLLLTAEERGFKSLRKFSSVPHLYKDSDTSSVTLEPQLHSHKVHSLQRSKHLWLWKTFRESTNEPLRHTREEAHFWQRIPGKLRAMERPQSRIC